MSARSRVVLASLILAPSVTTIAIVAKPSIELGDRPLSRDTASSDFGAANWGDVRLMDDRRTITIHLEEGDRTWEAPEGATISTLVVMGRRIWIGHELGVSMLRVNGPEDTKEWAHFNLSPPPRIDSANELRITSGVSHVLPVRVGDQVVWVSTNGGIGVAQAKRRPASGWNR